MLMGHDRVLGILARLDLRDEIAAMQQVYDHRLGERIRADSKRGR